MQLHRLVIVLCLCSASSFVLAQQDKKNNRISVEYVQDSNDTENVFVDLSVGVSDDTSVNLAWGNTQSDVSANDLDLDYFSVGVTHKYSKDFSLGLDYYSYAEDGEIEIDSVSASFSWNVNDWSLSLRPQFKSYKIYAEEISRARDIDSRGLGAGMVYYGIKNWELGLSHNSYQFSSDPRRLSSRIALEILSSKALTVASGLKDYSNNIDVTYLMKNTDIMLGYSQSKSAIDGTMSDVATIGVNFYHFYPMQIGIEAGSVDATSDDAGSFVGVKLGYLW